MTDEELGAIEQRNRERSSQNALLRAAGGSQFAIRFSAESDIKALLAEVRELRAQLGEKA